MEVKDIIPSKLYHTGTFSLSKVDSEGNPDLQELFLVFQKYATKHAEILSIDKDFYEPENLLYVLLRIKAILLKRMNTDEKYRIVTYALFPQKIQFYREAYIVNEKNEPVFLISSLWVLIDGSKRRLVTTDKLVKRLEPLSKEMKKLDYLFGRELKPLSDEKSEFCFNYQVKEEDIDNNKHMNNTVYFKLIQEAKLSSLISSIEINFEKESFLSDTLKIMKKEEDYGTYYCGINKDEKISFKAYVTYN